MPTLNVRGNIYNYPDPGTEPGWGPDATDWAVAVTDILNTILSESDIIKSVASIADDISIPANVTLLRFDGNVVWAANVPYSVQRDDVTQSGTLFLTYNADSGWSMNEHRINDAGVYFSITPAGQVQYISTATGEPGVIVFSAKTLGA